MSQLCCRTQIINIEKSVVLLYSKNELVEREVKKTTPFKIASKRINYLEINLTKKVKDLYSETDERN